jgi:hypothetical protein
MLISHGLGGATSASVDIVTVKALRWLKKVQAVMSTLVVLIRNPKHKPQKIVRKLAKAQHPAISQATH